MSDCPRCNGAGQTVHYETRCCGMVDEQGRCCDQPEQMEVIDACPDCQGSGSAPMECRAWG